MPTPAPVHRLQANKARVTFVPQLRRNEWHQNFETPSLDPNSKDCRMPSQAERKALQGIGPQVCPMLIAPPLGESSAFLYITVAQGKKQSRLHAKVKSPRKGQVSTQRYA